MVGFNIASLMVATWSGVGAEASRLLVGVVRGCGRAAWMRFGCLHGRESSIRAWRLNSQAQDVGHGKIWFHSALRRKLSASVRPLDIG